MAGLWSSLFAISIAFDVVHGCPSTYKTRRDTTALNELADFFASCQPLKEKAECVFESLQGVVDYVLIESNWFQNIQNSSCADDDDTAECWKSALDFLFKEHSTLRKPTAECIEKWSDEQHEQRPSGSQYPTNRRFEGTSISVLLRDHFIFCRTFPSRFSILRRSGRSRFNRDCNPASPKNLKEMLRVATRENGPLGKTINLSDPDTKQCETRSITDSPSSSAPGCLIEDEDGRIVIIHNTDGKNCSIYDECCWNQKQKTCVNKKVIITDTEDGRGFKVPKSGDDAARALGIGPPLPKCTILPKPFPTDCKYSRNQPYVLDPPLDIPYCVRIPCSLDREEQRKLDNSLFECGSKPGCYFDKELYEFRKDFGPAVLAGVPVCHLAIRNAMFLSEAHKAVALVGGWNPHYTKCLLDTFDEEIKTPPKGCELIDTLKIFRILPKLAGWDGITSYECTLIDGCWRPSEGCFYPVDVSRIVVKSNQRFRFNKYEVTYGRPKCQHFNDENPYELLKSYHKCLSAGCSVDANVAAKYYYYLFQIGNQMKTSDHWEYWNQVQRGKIGSNNIDKGVYWPFDKTFGKGTQPPKVEISTGDSNPFAPPPGPFSPPGGFPAPGGLFSPFTPPPIPDIPTFPPVENTRCGPIYKQQGSRPCPPKSPPKFNPSTWCPYKPFNVPRFKPLKGSFRGCCEINPCYLSRRDIREMHSGPSSYYTEWTPFSFCSATCGPGTQKRTRQCVTHDESFCTEKTEEERACQDQECGKWGDWGPWNPPFCESRFQLRTRKRFCHPVSAVCGPNQEKEEEENQYC